MSSDPLRLGTDGPTSPASDGATSAAHLTAPDELVDRPWVVFPGEPGSFAEDAVLQSFAAPRVLRVPSFRDVFESLAGDRSTLVGEELPPGPPDVGVVPIENVVGGTVRETYDLLLEHEAEIVGEVVVPVRLCLAALPGQRLDQIERVYSHIQALGQAEAFLRTRPWSLLASTNTAGAGKMIVERGERGSAAVLSPRAAALHGLEIIAPEIQTVADNRTRFLILVQPATPREPGGAKTGPHGGPIAASDAASNTGSDAAERARTSEAPRRWTTGSAIGADGRRLVRTTLVLAVPNVPGSLHRVLGILAAHELNMSKLESRPSRSRAWEYVFWVDLDGDLCSASGGVALEELRAATTMLRVMGCYPPAFGGP